MTETTPLNRRALAERRGHDVPAAPVRIAHLGLGAFHRAHQAWYTDAADPRNEWGIAAFTGRNAAAARELEAQDGLYTLVVRGADGDDATIVDSIAEAHDGADLDAFTRTIAAQPTSFVTLTVTEAGYVLDRDGALDTADERVIDDIGRLRSMLGARELSFHDGPRTALGRLLLGLEARRRSGAAPIAILPSDNLPGNGTLVREAVRTLAEHAAPSTLEYLESSVAFVSSSVDRITPKTTPADVAAAARLSGFDDRSPVVTEPFRDWVLSGAFPAGRPEWELAGARFVDDVEPFERRKLWLLNGAHTLLALAGASRGHETVAEAIDDAEVRGWVDEFWDEAVRHLPGAVDLDLDRYRADLVARFANHRIRHRLSQIALDAVTKLRVRIVPVLLAERAAGRRGDGGIRILVAWVRAARDATLPGVEPGSAVARAAAGPRDQATLDLLTLVSPALAADPALVADISRAAARAPLAQRPA